MPSANKGQLRAHLGQAAAVAHDELVGGDQDVELQRLHLLRENARALVL